MIRQILSKLLLFTILLLLPTVSLACDEKFIQEPVTAPVKTYEDLWIGFEYRDYEFPDGRKLTVIRQMKDIMGEEIEQFPLFYIVTDHSHVSITYIDRAGFGQCVDINRY